MNIYIPVVAVPPINPDQPSKAQEFFEMLKNDPRQNRKLMEWSKLLEKAASIRTESLARLGYWAHCEPNGPCPNEVARSVGCVFPFDYSEKGNNIESLVAGTPDVAVAFEALANSPSHRNHMFGVGSFLERQNRVGIHVRYDSSSTFKWYYSILIAELV